MKEDVKAELQAAPSINDAGWTTGVARRVGESQMSGTRGFLLIPVPEPTMRGVVAVGSAALAARRRRRA